MKSAWRIVWLGVLLLPASGCHMVRAISASACHDTQTYMKERSVAPLKIPTGLDAPDTTSALHLPQLNEPSPPPRRGKDPCLDAPPPFKVQQPALTPSA
jgi:uncharacterized lipoprotein